MRLDTLINSKETLGKIYEVSLNGMKALKFRRVLKEANEEIALFEEARTVFIQKNGKKSGDGETATFTLDQDTPEYEEFVIFINELASSETKIKINPLFEEADLEQTELSVRDIDNLIKLGLLQEEKLLTP